MKKTAKIYLQLLGTSTIFIGALILSSIISNEISKNILETQGLYYPWWVIEMMFLGTGVVCYWTVYKWRP